MSNNNNKKYGYVSQKKGKTQADSFPVFSNTNNSNSRSNTLDTASNSSFSSSSSKDTSKHNSKKRGDGYENTRSEPFPVLEPDLFYAPPNLMTDAQVASFIENGFHVIDTGLPADFHDKLYAYSNGKEILRFTNNPGNNVLPVIPSLEYVFECPNVRGALQSILGQNYMMHAHRHPHCNPPGFKGQQFHKDSFFGYELGRHHYPVWVMAMYYPQDTPIVLGPTAISPTTQYSGLQVTKKRHLDVTSVWKTKDLPLECKKGTVVLIHYDLWHKGTPNLGDVNRFMFKFQFMRMTPPTGPTWQNASPEYPLKDSLSILLPLHVQVWKWMRGDQKTEPITTTSDQRKKLFSLIRDSSVEGEPGRLHAAYTLAQDPDSVSGLCELIYSEQQSVRRSALYGLSTSRDPEVVQLLVETLPNKRSKFPFKNEIILTLSDMGALAVSAVPVLLNALSDIPPEHGGSAAAEAIGFILYWLDQNDKAGAFLKDAKWQDDFYKALQPALRDSNEVVRFNACLSLARLGKFDVAARFVKELERCATMDQNRYVRAYAVEALQRIPTAEASKAALRLLNTARYCPVTTFDSTF